MRTTIEFVQNSKWTILSKKLKPARQCTKEHRYTLIHTVQRAVLSHRATLSTPRSPSSLMPETLQKNSEQAVGDAWKQSFKFTCIYPIIDAEHNWHRLLKPVAHRYLC